MNDFDEADDMCPNCLTPWKCNGPHLSDQTPYALSGQREKDLEEGMNAFVTRLGEIFHELRWCKSSDILHAFAHDENDEDGYRAKLIAEWRQGKKWSV
jgi:hypothetical protein